MSNLGIFFETYNKCPKCGSGEIEISRCKSCGFDSKKCKHCGTGWQEAIE